MYAKLFIALLIGATVFAAPINDDSCVQFLGFSEGCGPCVPVYVLGFSVGC